MFYIAPQYRPVSGNLDSWVCYLALLCMLKAFREAFRLSTFRVVLESLLVQSRVPVTNRLFILVGLI